ncbi:MAG TPA: tetratricopeptide repeat protein [Bryobacteraceae bacterium]|nr:tetratricopeptide repeat protein [Bryobacteraceae bacterium]
MLIRLLIASLVLFTTRSLASDQNQLDGSPSLFSVMAALNAAGLDAGLSSASGHPLREVVRKHLEGKQLSGISELQNFIKSHYKKEPGADLAQYISFALAVDGPPSFKVRFRPAEVPPDVVALEGFDVLMARFHREADIDTLWKRVQPSYDQAIGRYQEPVTRALLEVNGYLRNVTSGYMGRRFQIYLDLLGPSNQTHTRSYGDEYFIVLAPAPEPETFDVRHAYLHYLLDPLSIKFSEQINKKRGLIDFAQGSPTLDEAFKSDFLLLTTESLIKAIESRLERASGPARVQQALAEGFVLTPFFAEHLPAYEKQEVAMRLYFPDLVSAIDLKKEDRRLTGVQFASTRAVRKSAPAVQPAAPELSTAEKTVEQADKLYGNRELEGARNVYRRVLEETDQKSLHARAYYGLARIAALQKDPELAEKLFTKALESEPDGQTRAWSLVYLGRLSEASGDHQQAAKFFQGVLNVDGASAGARQAAGEALKKTTKQ